MLIKTRAQRYGFSLNQPNKMIRFNTLICLSFSGFAQFSGVGVGGVACLFCVDCGITVAQVRNRYAAK